MTEPIPKRHEFAARDADAPALTPSMLLVGNVDSGGDTGRASSTALTRYAPPEERTAPFLPLAEGPNEMASIGKLFRRTFRGSFFTVLQKESATETAVRSSLPGVRWAHFATHSFSASSEALVTKSDPTNEKASVFN